MTVVEVASLAAIIVSIASIIISWRKAPHESNKFDADASKTFEEGAALAAGRANRLEERIVSLETKIQDQDKRIRHLEEENTRLNDWAMRLVSQVRSLGGQPVKMRYGEAAGDDG